MNPAKYHAKPIEIEAVQVDTADYDGLCEIIRWIGPTARAIDWNDMVIQFDTPDGVIEATQGDWIIRSASDQFSLCKPGAFAVIYEAQEPCLWPSGYHDDGDPMNCSKAAGHSGDHAHYDAFTWADQPVVENQPNPVRRWPQS